MDFWRVTFCIVGTATSLPAMAALPRPPVETDAIPVILLVDVNSGRTLAARQPELRFVPASMTKVMTVYTALGLIERGQLDPAHQFVVNDAIAREWNGKGTSLYLKAGERVSAEQLIRAITTVSANDAAVVLAEGAGGSIGGWTNLMNADARALGMRASHFATPNGWPDGGRTFVSASDLVRLGSALITRYPAQYRHYFGQRYLTWNGVTQKNHDPTTGIVAGADGIKTGYTREAGYNFLGSAQRDGRRLMMVVGGAHSAAQRADASRALLEWGFAAWAARPLFAPGAPIGTARVQNGSERDVPLVARTAVMASFPRESKPDIRLTIRYKGPLVAPLKQGEKVADLVIDSGDGQQGIVQLFTAKSVKSASILNRLVNGFMGLFT